MKNKLSLLFAGFIMGLTHFIPGVSCATVALAANIYRDMAEALANIREHFSISIKLLLPLILGILAALALGLTALAPVIKSFQAPLQYFFLGVTLACLILVSRRMLRPKFDIWGLIPLFVALAIMLAYFFWTPTVHELNFTRFDAKTFFLLFGSGTFGSAAVLLPGVSVLDMIYLFHTDPLYPLIIQNHEIAFLLPILCGCALGFIGLGWLVTYTFAKRPSLLYGALIGFLLGAVPTLIGNWGALENKALCLLMAAAGAFATWFLNPRLHLSPEDMVFPEKIEIEREYHIFDIDDGWDS